MKKEMLDQKKTSRMITKGHMRKLLNANQNPWEQFLYSGGQKTRARTQDGFFAARMGGTQQNQIPTGTEFNSIISSVGGGNIELGATTFTEGS